MFCLLVCLLVFLPSCRRSATEYPPYDNTKEVQAFFKRYNKETKANAEKLKAEIEKKLAEAEKSGAPADNETTEQRAEAPSSEASAQDSHSSHLSPEDRAELEKQLAEVTERLENFPQFFTFASEDALPKDLDWKTGMDSPDIGSPDAKKGGTWNTYFPSMAFPPTIRVFGKEANNGFRGEHWDNIELGLLGVHPNTLKPIPSLADRWAVDPNGRTVYFHIDDETTWSDGTPVVATDFFMTFYIYLSPYLTEPWYRTYYGKQFWNITKYSDKLISITLAHKKPQPEYFASIVPMQRDFYREFGPDFEDRYNWRCRPTTGAYVIKPEDIVKGRSITLSRVKNWWAKDRKYYRHCYNADRMHYWLVRDENKLFELFRKGQIDFMPLGLPKFWYEKTEIPEVFNGYIHKVTFYNVYPRTPRGLYLNFANPLIANRDIRIGLQYATNWRKVIDFDLRGDARRLQIYNDGYGRFSNKKVRARPFDPAKAREAFARAGFAKVGPDGVLRNAEGKRLSFTITYTRSPFSDQIMQRLKEEALKAGLEYKLEAMDGVAAYQKVMRKEHDITLWGWGTSPPYPRYREGFHMDNAFDKNGNPKPQTNNISCYVNPEVSKLADEIRNASDEDTIERDAKRIEEILNENAVWIPGYTRDFYRVGFWRWMKWPKEFNVMLNREGYESYVWWIDVEEKKRTLEAMKEGRKFPEVNEVYDQYRDYGKGKDDGTQDSGTSKSTSSISVSEQNSANPEGVLSPSPGLARGTRAYPGKQIHPENQPQRGCVSGTVSSPIPPAVADATPLGLAICPAHVPGWLRSAPRPWAERRNPVGIPMARPVPDMKPQREICLLSPCPLPNR
jgi:microcin C transport system substrate-binding protein